MPTVAVDFLAVFPASAGVILSALLLRKLTLRFPRIRGGDPEQQREFYLSLEFSPHLRG